MIFPGVQELDDKYVTVTKVESRQEYERQTQDYQTTNFGGRTENGKNYFPNEDKDFMEVRNLTNFQFLQTFLPILGLRVFTIPPDFAEDFAF